MNPEENAAKAARAIIAAKKEYPSLTLSEMDDIARSHQSAAPEALALIAKLRGDHGNAVATGLQGFTGNFADELVDIPKLWGGEGGGEVLKLRDELFHVDHSVLAPLLELAGGIGSAAVTGGLGGGFSGVANAAQKAAVAGGIYGGVAGAGAGETASERLTGAGEGTLEGLVLGGTVGALGGRAAQALQRNLKVVTEAAGIAKVSEASAALRKQGEAMLERVNKMYANDPVMRDVATAGVKKMHPELNDIVEEAAAKAPKAAKEPKEATPLATRIVGALPSFLFGSHSGSAAVAHALFKHATSDAAKAAVSEPAPIVKWLGAQNSVHLGQGSAILLNLIKSLHKD